MHMRDMAMLNDLADLVMSIAMPGTQVPDFEHQFSRYINMSGCFLQHACNSNCIPKIEMDMVLKCANVIKHVVARIVKLPKTAPVFFSGVLAAS